MSFDAIIFLPPRGKSEAENWLADGRLACAMDLVERLQKLSEINRILFLAASDQDREQVGATKVQLLPPVADFHFGRTLSQIIRDHSIERLAYFGGSSAPLATRSFLQEVISQAHELPETTVLPNNLHSTDWAFITNPHSLESHAGRLPNDNALGWVLTREAGFREEKVRVCAASRFDVDTPSDLLIAHRHQDVGPNLVEFYESHSTTMLKTIDDLRSLLLTPASTLTLIGRSSSHVLGELERRTQVWTRLIVEERGMVASGRLAKKQVQTILTRISAKGDMKALMEFFEATSDGVFWDNRVWLAATGGFPSPADRFAADLGRVDEVSDDRLRSLTHAVQESSLPILAGGHGVVAGGLLALLESLGPETHHPSRN
jgi:hypothetical protein